MGVAVTAAVVGAAPQSLIVISGVCLTNGSGGVKLAAWCTVGP